MHPLFYLSENSRIIWHLIYNFEFIVNVIALYWSKQGLLILYKIDHDLVCAIWVFDEMSKFF